jgi:hypothetical protein
MRVSQPGGYGRSYSFDVIALGKFSGIFGVRVVPKVPGGGTSVSRLFEPEGHERRIQQPAISPFSKIALREPPHRHLVRTIPQS